MTIRVSIEGDLRGMLANLERQADRAAARIVYVSSPRWALVRWRERGRRVTRTLTGTFIVREELGPLRLAGRVVSWSADGRMWRGEQPGGEG